MLSGKMKVITEALRGQLLNFRVLREKDIFLQQYTTIKSRYKFLVLCGESGTGKTVWVKWMLGNPDLVFEANCACCPEPDLRNFSHFQHKVILFDEASPELVITQKKLFQSPPCFVKLGMSTTNCHSYDVFVSGTMMVICSNTWQEDLESMKKPGDRAWLVENSIVVNVGADKLWLPSL